MTTDPVERVARWTPEAERLARILAESNGCDPDKVLKWGPVGPIHRVWGRYLGQSQAVIKRLTKQGIPIDKLLADEMVAVAAPQTEDQHTVFGHYCNVADTRTPRAGQCDTMAKDQQPMSGNDKPMGLSRADGNERGAGLHPGAADRDGDLELSADFEIYGIKFRVSKLPPENEIWIVRDGEVVLKITDIWRP